MKNKITKALAKPPFVGVIAIIGVMILTFQNCSKVHFAANQISNAEFESSTQMQINKGAKYTNVTGVELEFTVPTADDMYVTNDSTCTAGGTWQQLTATLPWHLGQTDQVATVYAKFRAPGGAELPCVSASIIHDDQPPVVTFVTFPSGFTNVVNEVLSLSGTDNLSGIDHYECLPTGSSAFTTCTTAPQVTSTSDGPFTFQVRAVDRAGNYSQPIEKDWVFDHTAPIVTITSTPANPSSSAVGQFAFTATDGTNGSGVDHLMCQLDGETATVCSQSITYSNPLLMNGNHTFSVVGYDKAGNVSTPVSYHWVVNYPASSAFQVLGVTGPAGAGDQTIDGYLGTSLSPTLYWSASTGASYYDLAIYNSGTTTEVCSQNNIAAVAGPVYSFGSNCTLIDTDHYDVIITAYTANGTTRTAGTFTFQVDDTAPAITFGTVNISTDQKTVIVPFTVTDLVSGVQSATCSIYNSKYQTTQTFDCTNTSTYTFTNLADGPHVFTIVATDKASNVRTSRENFDTNLIICDPFILVDSGCVQGLHADLYYLPADSNYNVLSQYSQYETAVDNYINYGVKADATIYMSSVFVPTRSFQTGFNSANNTYVTDNSNNKLVAWFALDLQTVLKLGPNDAPGYYQLAAIHDDGAVVQTMVNGKWTDYFNGDGYASSSMTCDQTGTYFDSTTRLQVRIKYFQGPPDEIALVLMWRKLAGTPTTANMGDAECQTGGGGGHGGAYWFGASLNDFTSQNNHYGQLLSRGWYTPVSANFELNQAAPTN